MKINVRRNYQGQGTARLRYTNNADEKVVDVFVHENGLDFGLHKGEGSLDALQERSEIVQHAVTHGEMLKDNPTEALDIIERAWSRGTPR